MATGWQRLRLTAEEKQYNDYYDRRKDGRFGVKPRRYPNSRPIVLSLAQPVVSIPYFATRRARVHAITWAGDVSGVTVEIETSLGEKWWDRPVHIPSVSGHSPASTLSAWAALAPIPAPAPGVAPNATPNWSQAPCWIHNILPNFDLPSNETLTLTYRLENTADPGLANPASSYLIEHVIHAWEFPGYQGGPL